MDVADRKTIVACATPWGRGAISVVRLSGPETRGIISKVCGLIRGLPPARRSRLVSIRDPFQPDASPIDEGILVWMPGPSSYTGEDLAEISCHGNPLIVRRLLQACLRCGARMADPGEFTRRALLSGRMDLTRAEAVLQVIEARSEAGIQVARQGMDGSIARWVEEMTGRIREICVQLEARLDFPELDLEYQDLSGDSDLPARLHDLAEAVHSLARSQKVGRVLVDGARVALTGPVNAGKSSLFNALLGRNRALVSPQPGTTRDVIECQVNLGNMPITLMDTAGDREHPGELEAAGIMLREELVADADLLVLVLPAHLPDLSASHHLLQRTGGRPRVVVGNHSDRAGAVHRLGGVDLLPTCATDGSGVQALSLAITAALVHEEPSDARLMIASERQREILEDTGGHLHRAASALTDGAGMAIAAEEALASLETLERINGTDAREAVIDALFSRFCVGK